MVKFLFELLFESKKCVLKMSASTQTEKPISSQLVSAILICTNFFNGIEVLKSELNSLNVTNYYYRVCLTAMQVLEPFGKPSR